MRKFLTIVSVLLIVCMLAVSVSAVDNRSIIYLYRDFVPVTQTDSGLINYRYTVEANSIFSTASSIVNGVTNNNFVTLRGNTISFDALYGGNYWVNMYPLGTGLTDINSGNPFNLLNVVSLQGFMSGAMLWIGYSLTGANIFDDHHDIWIQYYDSNMNATDNIQYTGKVSTTDGRFFGVEVPIGVGSNPDNSFFSVTIQIDDIAPISDGVVSLTFNGVAISTTGTATGGDLWNPVNPQTPPSNNNNINEFDGNLSALFDSVFEKFTDYYNNMNSYLNRFSVALGFIGNALTVLLTIDVIQILITFSVVLGCVALIYNLSDFEYKSFNRRSSKRMRPTKKGDG